MRRLLILTLLLIAYGSLYPWRFHPLPPDMRPLWLLFHSWPNQLNRGLFEDMGLNVLLYVPVGLFGFLAFARRSRAGIAMLAACAVGFGTSTAVEIAQQFDLFRNSSALDVFSNTTGAFFGAILGWVVLHRTVDNWAEQWLQHADALLLTLGWIAWQVFPGTPYLTRTGDLIVSFRISDHPGAWAGLDFAVDLAQTFALARVIETLTGSPLSQSKRARLWFGALLLLVPCKAVIWGRGVSAVEIAAVAVAYVACVFLPRIPAVPLLLGAVIVIAGLAPFHFVGPAQSFSWMPFRASLESDWFSGIPILLGKAFRYAALVWLLREANWRWWIAGGFVAMLLAILEVLQMWLPVHSSEITDPILPILVTIAFWAAHDAFETLPRAPQVR